MYQCRKSSKRGPNEEKAIVEGGASFHTRNTAEATIRVFAAKHTHNKLSSIQRVQAYYTFKSSGISVLSLANVLLFESYITASFRGITFIKLLLWLVIHVDV